MQIKPFCLVALSTLLCIYSFSQTAFLHQHAYGAPGSSDFRDIKATTDGGMICGGSSNANKGIDKTGNNQDPSGVTTDYWIVKTDAHGRKQWDRTLGGSDNDLLTCILPTSDGGYLVGGYSYSGISGDKTGANRGTKFFKTNDYWIVKLDKRGNTQWDKTIGGDEFDYLTSIENGGDGGYVLAGASTSSASGEKSEGNRGWNADYWIVKLDAQGNKQWDKTFGGNDDDYATQIKKTRDGGYIVSGGSISDNVGDKTEKNKGFYDCWFVKINSEGNKQWDKTIGGTGGDDANSVIQTADGGYMAGCTSASPMSYDKTQNSKGENDYWMVKLNSAGQKEWDKTIGGNKSDVATGMQQTQDSGFIIGGYSASGISGDKSEACRGVYDYWIVKVTKAGKVEWNKTIGGQSDDECLALCEYAKNNYLIGGSSYSGVSGDKNKKLKGSRDYWIVLLTYQQPAAIPASIITATSPLINNTDHFVAYPVPAKDILHIQSAGKAVYTLTSGDGKTVLSRTLNGNGEMDVSRLAAGVYYLQNATTNEQKKILIVK